MTSPLISIIMPVKNGLNYLDQALKAIQSQQVDMEIIVVDDGSSDDSARLAESFGCRIVRNSVSEGSVISKNKGLQAAKGKYVMFHDHDDVMNEGVLVQMLQEIENNHDVAAVMAQLQDYFSPEMTEEEKQKVMLRQEVYFGLFSGSILMRKDVFDVIGLFDESLQAGDVIDWTSKMRENNLHIKKMNIIAVNRRIHNSNYGRTNKAQEYKDYASILRAKLKRNVV